MRLADGRVAQASFADYNLPRFRDVPPMTIALVDEGDSPTGAGETAIVAAPAAARNGKPGRSSQHK